eukprot:scaffold9942_cov57-Phaeocystis_antarctica.AAC.5
MFHETSRSRSRARGATVGGGGGESAQAAPPCPLPRSPERTQGGGGGGGGASVAGGSGGGTAAAGWRRWWSSAPAATMLSTAAAQQALGRRRHRDIDPHGRAATWVFAAPLKSEKRSSAHVSRPEKRNMLAAAVTYTAFSPCAACEAAALKVRPDRKGAQDGEVAEEGDPHPADEEGERAVEVEALDHAARVDLRVGRLLLRQRRAVARVCEPADAQDCEKQRDAQVLQRADDGGQLGRLKVDDDEVRPRDADDPAAGLLEEHQQLAQRRPPVDPRVHLGPRPPLYHHQRAGPLERHARLGAVHGQSRQPRQPIHGAHDQWARRVGTARLGAREALRRRLPRVAPARGLCDALVGEPPPQPHAVHGGEPADGGERHGPEEE